MPADFQISEHYNGTVRIKFYPNSHRYQLEGRRDYLIGVTTATGMADKSKPLLIWAGRLTKEYLLKAMQEGREVNESLIEEAINWHELEKLKAAASGTLVHAWAESYIKGEKPDVPEDPNVRNGVLAFLKWVNENGVKFIASEKRIYSKEHEYVGTMDCIFTMKKEGHGVIHAGDFKTSSGIYMEMAMQVSAYQEAEAEEHGTKYGDKYILRFDKNTGQFETKSFTHAEHIEHFQGFLACLELKRQSKVWEKEHGYYSKK
ncbi:MAG: hypothetical protein AAB588_03125 [Patescibacteria group bacterium]|mgnify:CR=1 FL=1